MRVVGMNRVGCGSGELLVEMSVRKERMVARTEEEQKLEHAAHWRKKTALTWMAKGQGLTDDRRSLEPHTWPWRRLYLEIRKDLRCFCFISKIPGGYLELDRGEIPLLDYTSSMYIFN